MLIPPARRRPPSRPATRAQAVREAPAVTTGKQPARVRTLRMTTSAAADQAPVGRAVGAGEQRHESSFMRTRKVTGGHDTGGSQGRQWVLENRPYQNRGKGISP